MRVSSSAAVHCALPSLSLLGGGVFFLLWPRHFLFQSRRPFDTLYAVLGSREKPAWEAEEVSADVKWASSSIKVEAIGVYIISH